MSDTTAGTSDATTGAPAETSSGPATESQATSTAPESGSSEQSSQGNPAWETYRSKLGDNFFKLIEKDLAEDDRRAQTRISEANAKAKQYEEFGTPDDIRAARQLAQQVGTDPKGVYERLGDWLRQNGQLEAAAAADAQAEALDDEEDSEDTDPRLAELQQGQQQIQEFLAQQQRQAAIEQTTAEFQTQMKDIRGKNEWMSEDDENEILSRALANAQTSDKDVDLGEAAEQYISLRTRFLTTPRPGDSAPRLVPSGGGAPARSSGFDFNSASKEDRAKYVAEYLNSQK